MEDLSLIQNIPLLIAVLALWYPLFGIPAGLGVGTLYFFGRKRIRFLRLDSCLLFVPYILWGLLGAFGGLEKAEGNIILEPLGLGISIPFVYSLRLFLAKKIPQEKIALTALILACLIAVGLWSLIPRISE